MSNGTNENPWAAAGVIETPQNTVEDPGNPWATGSGETGTDGTAGNPWGSQGDSPAEGAAAQAETNWLESAAASRTEEPEVVYTLSDPFGDGWVPFDKWVEQGLDWTVDNFREFFQAISMPIEAVLIGIDAALQSLSPLFIILFFTILAWQVSGKKLGIGTLLSLICIGAVGAWAEAMITLALVITSVFFCLVAGVPMGIWMSRSDRAASVIRPVLDAMQTTPAFVYLVPIVMLFGIGNVPGVVVTIIFALPPLIRLTNLGIRQVPSDLIEASQSFGANPMQLLFRVQLPVAMPTIMAGVNQTLMLSLSMVVVASMIAVEGLGQMVLRGIGRLDMGLAAVGGLGIVLLAVVLDRLTQSFGEENRVKEHSHWYETGPVGMVCKLIKKQNQS